MGRSPGEGIGYPFQYSWASLVTQLVKNPPAIWETWVGSLGWEDPLEEGKVTHSYSPWGCKESDTTEQLSLNSSTWLSRCSISSPGQLSSSTGNCPCQPSPGAAGPSWVTVTEQRLSSFLSIPVLAHFQDQSTHVPNTPAPRGSALSNLLSAAALCSFPRV